MPPQMKPIVGAAFTAPANRSAGLAGAAPPPPRPPRPPRPAAAARPPARPAAGGAALTGGAGAGAGGARAASSGPRSLSVDHRNNSIDKGFSVAATPMGVARNRSAGSSARTRLPPASNASTITPTGALARRTLLAVIVVCSSGAAQPLHQALQLLVFQPGAALPHVHGDDAPPIGREACAVDAVHGVTGRARTLQCRLSLGVGEKRRDDRSHIR